MVGMVGMGEVRIFCPLFFQKKGGGFRNARRECYSRCVELYLGV